jgi:hypothetical protein
MSAAQGRPGSNHSCSPSSARHRHSCYSHNTNRSNSHSIHSPNVTRAPWARPQRQQMRANPRPAQAQALLRRQWPAVLRILGLLGPVMPAAPRLSPHAVRLAARLLLLLPLLLVLRRCPSLVQVPLRRTATQAPLQQEEEEERLPRGSRSRRTQEEGTKALLPLLLRLLVGQPGWGLCRAWAQGSGQAVPAAR